MIIRKTWLASLSLCFFALLSIAGEHRSFDPVQSTVVVHNPNMQTYHTHCLGLVISLESIVVPIECRGGSGLHGAIKVYSTPEDADGDKNGVEAQSHSDRYSDHARTVILHLKGRLKDKTPAVIGNLDLTCRDAWSCYYLARQQEKMIINKRSMRTPLSTGGKEEVIGNQFNMITGPQDNPQFSADYIKGAILFNERNEAVAIGYDDVSIYSLYMGHSHKFHRLDTAFHQRTAHFSGGL